MPILVKGESLPNGLELVLPFLGEQLADTRLVAVNREDQNQAEDNHRDVHPNGHRSHRVHQLAEAAAIDGAALREGVKLAEEEHEASSANGVAAQASEHAGENEDGANELDEGQAVANQLDGPIPRNNLEIVNSLHRVAQVHHLANAGEAEDATDQQSADDVDADVVAELLEPLLQLAIGRVPNFRFDCVFHMRTFPVCKTYS